MAEPTKEELMARIAELEKQAASKKSGKLEFKAKREGRYKRLRLRPFPYDPLLRTSGPSSLDAGEDLRAFLEANKSSLKLKI